jgi:hypothetical protein
MATQPDPNPDTINPDAPPEYTPDSIPETPDRHPGEIQPPSPDTDNPGTNPLETPPPPD